MIEYIRGSLAELTPAYAVIETNGGVGYFLNITLTAYTELEGKKEACLLVHEAIREDAFQLFGFINERERALFRALIGVSGVGANTARVILSSIPAPELEQVIVSGDIRRLKAVKGIGSKTAERILVDLKDKIKITEGTVIQLSKTNTETYEEALAALVMLGFPKPAASKVLGRLIDAEPTIKVEAAIKKALAML